MEDFDTDAAYFQTLDDVDPAEQAEEFDTAYATYLDARKRFNEIKLSRGYLPIVALTDGNLSPGAASPHSSGSPVSPGRGKGKTKKGKGKGGSNTIRYPPRGKGKEPDPKGRARASSGPPTCLRCGQVGHMTYNCPVPKGGATKRKTAPTESTVNHSEHGHVIFTDLGGHERHDCAMLDPGASAFLSGYGPFLRYMLKLKETNYDITEIKFMRCQRTFFFGGDASLNCTWTVRLPLHLGGKHGYVQMYLLPGETPMLLGRPIMEALGLVLDCRSRMIKLDDTPWQDAVVGAHGEYLVSLLNEYDNDMWQFPPSFELMVPADGGTSGDFLDFGTFNKETKLFDDISNVQAAAQDGLCALKRHVLQTCDVTLNTLENKLHAYVTEELHQPSRKRLLWEVYCGGARVSAIAESMGMDVEIFSYETGWDFDLEEHQTAFMERLRTEMPDEVYLAPTCGPWSQMQNLNAKTEAQQHDLYLKRSHHHDCHLMFVAQIYMEQINNARHAHIEQPERALSWRTTALKDLPGHWIILHQCMFGCACLDKDGWWKLVKKPTGILSSKTSMQAALAKLCDGQHVHCPLEGSAPGLGRRTSYLEDYQPGLAATIAAALCAPDPAQLWDYGFAVSEQKEVTGCLVKLQTALKTEAVRTVQRLHRNLGHPKPEALVELLQSRGASDQVIEAARHFQCTACLRYKRPNQVAPSALRHQVREVGERLQADVLWIKCNASEKKFPVLSVIDQATKYTVATVLHGERGDHLIHGLERAWIRHFGLPQCLCSDEGRGWVGEEMNAWTTQHAIEHIVAPAESHRLALVERRHVTLRRAIEIYMDDMKVTGTKGIRQALTYVVPQLNDTVSVAGYSPSQWLLGKVPRLPGGLMQEELAPAHLGDHDQFEQLLQQRAAAKRALISADLDAKLRRALLRQYQGTDLPLQIGQKCFFWRDQRQDRLVKIRWHGPARIVMVEYSKDEKPELYWLAYKTQLIRCSPHHVRADFTAADTQLADAQEARREVASLRSRGVTRFLDLNKINRRRRLEDFNEDDIASGSEAGDDDADDLQPPTTRQRTSYDTTAQRPELSLDEAIRELGLEDEDELSMAPTSPADTPAEHPEFPGQAQPAVLPAPAVPALPPPDQVPQGDNVVPINVDEDEPGQEPATLPTLPPTPDDASAPAPDPFGLTSTSSALYEPAQEDFRTRRLRMDQHETMQFTPFGPMRRGAGRHDPYPQQAPPADPQPASELFGQAFAVDDIGGGDLPKGWSIDEHGYFQLDAHNFHDYWEIKAGCLIRHHLQPRHRRHDITKEKDCPFDLKQLDPVRVTMMRAPNGTIQVSTDRFDTVVAPNKATWTGLTVYQLTGAARKELAMYATTPAKRVARQEQHAAIKKKASSELNERGLTMHEREQFMQAKIKELRSFFENGVWEFSSVRDADPQRTLTSRMLLKWSKNPDGSPRAKARLVVRGYNDQDALEGKVETSAPTTSRLSRSMFLSLSSILQWCGWTADVATAFLQGLPQERQLWVKLPREVLNILGADETTRMLLRKPCYGQIDAPRRWFLEASRRLTSIGLRPHMLDPCCFLICEADFPDIQASDPSKCLGSERIVGMVCIHVDDMLGGGLEESLVYQHVVKQLRQIFNFREWKDQDKLEYCGASLQKTPTGGWKVDHAEYLRKVKPISLQRDRGPEDYMTPSEVTQMRGLLGSLQWPAVQSQPHLQCSTSLLAGQVSAGLVKSIHDANRLLKFAKLNADVALCYERICDVQDLRLVTMVDAAFGIRRDGSSQGGYLTMLVSKDVFDGTEGAYHIIDWRSSKLPRVARSSLGAEAQSASQACDNMDFVCRFYQHLLEPNEPLANILHKPSPLEPTLVTDAKALYDSYYRESLSSGLTDKRTGLEIKVLREGLESLGGRLKWISSERQYADSLTKEGTRQLLADRLRYGRIKLSWDPDYIAAKRKKLSDRNASRDEFSQPLATVVEEPETTEDVPVETFACFGEEINYEMNDWDEMSGKAVAAHLELRPDQAIDLNFNDTLPIVHTPIMDISYDPETKFEGVWTILSLRALLRFALCILMLGLLQPLGAAAAPLSDPITPDTCPYIDVIQEPKTSYWDYFWDAVVVLTLVVFVVGTYLTGWVHGWWIGRNHVLRQRHIRSDRLSARLDEKVVENIALQDQIEELTRQVQQLTVPGGPIIADREIRHLQQQLKSLEASFWQKDQQCRQMNRHKMGYVRQIGRLRAIFQEAKDVVGRARAEIHNHVHNRCTVGRPIYHAPRGRVWHLDDQCYQLYRSAVIELHACDNCASFYVTPYIHDMNNTTLAQDMDNFMANGLADEDPEVLAEASAILDDEARLRAAGVPDEEARLASQARAMSSSGV